MAEPWNTFAEGDNLDVLATLPDGSFDLVYLDPPYNTGNDFAYRDDFRGARGDGTTGRHAAWVAFMRPRLEAGRRVLADTGAVFVSIDDHEVAHLRLLMDQVYGEHNLLAQVVVNLNPKGRQLGRGFATSHEYVLAYAKDAARCVLDASSSSTVVESDFPLVAEDGRRYRRLPLRNTNKKFNPVTAPTLHFPVWGSPETGRVATKPFEGAIEIKPVFGDGAPAVWRWSRPRIDERPGDLECRWVRGTTGDRVDVFQRDWLHVTHDGKGRRKKLRTIWLAQEVGSTDTAVAELKEVLGHIFESPKPTGLVRRILDTMPPDCRVLDYFAGSGTTGHAVALANAADGGRRTCLSVNSAEPTRPGSNAALAGYPTVSAITRARLMAVAEQVGGGFAVRTLPPRACNPPTSRVKDSHFVARRTFTRAELESFRDAEVPDLLPTGPEHELKLLFVGINPGLWTAATSTHFAHPGNRFYPALLLAGVIDEPIDPANGMTDEDRDALRARGIGITNVVRRATAKASELTNEELREGGRRLTELVARERPLVVAVAGITAYRAAFGLPKAVPGRQLGDLAGAELWVVPNPSGLNAHETVTSLAEAYRRVGEAAGIVPATTA